MRIAIAAPSSVPFRLGGAERAWNGLLREFIETTPHQADLIKLPAPEQSLSDVVAGYEAFGRLDLSSFDLLITTKYPAWMTFHENHVVYLFHPLRTLYDLYPSDLPKRVDLADEATRKLLRVIRGRPDRAVLEEVFGRFRDVSDQLGPADPALTLRGPLARELVHFLDRVGLDPRHVRRHLALSRTVAGRRDYFPAGASVEVLYLPPSIDAFTCRGFDYLFTPSRLEANKRVDLLIEAMRYVASDIPLKIAGAGPELDRLRELAAGDSRIELLGSLSDCELIDAYADALAVPVVPHDEELGLVTLEAMRSSKPVITCHDSGGPTELVEEGRSGFVTEPTPPAIAAAIDRLAADVALARRLGEAGRGRAEAVTWQRTVTRLLESPAKSQERKTNRTKHKIVIASAARVHPPRDAAGLRSAHLARTLASEYEVEIVSLGVYGDPTSRRIVTADVVETVVPRSEAHAAAEAQTAQDVGLPVEDLLAAAAVRSAPEYGFALGRACRSAAALVLSRPYLQPAVAALPRPLPFTYYAHLAEAHAWGALLPATPEGKRLLALALAVERGAIHGSGVVLVSTEDDARLLSEDGIDAERPIPAALGIDPGAVRLVAASERAEGRNKWLRRFLERQPSVRGVDRLALFLGSRFAVDIDAARRLEGLADRLPHVLHVVVGCTYEDLGRVKPPNLVATGPVSQAMRQALLTAADVALVPVPHPGITRLEPAECLAAGIPCVSTPEGTHGLPVEDGVHALLRDLSEFPTAVDHLLTEPAVAERLSREGRRLVGRHYDSTEGERHALDAVRELIEAKRNRLEAAKA